MNEQNNQQNPFSKLEPSWKSWVIDCVERGCTLESMVKVMIKDGPFSEHLAKSIIKAARRELKLELESEEQFCPRPDINTQANYIDLDRRINIVMTMNAPRIVVLANVLSDEECDALIAEAEAKLIRSLVVDANTEASVEDSSRTSSYTMFQRGESPLLITIEKRLAALADWPIEKGEGLQVLHYKTGEFYLPHFDWFDSKLQGHQARLKQGKQRVGTFVLYLSDVEAGGSTSFPKFELEVRPHRGMAVFFADIEPNGQPDNMTLHGSEPVIRGVKWVATKWLREEKFS